MGNLTLRTDEGCAMITYSYDEFGQCTYVSYKDKNRELVTNYKVHCASISYAYDERGNNTYIWYWNSDDELAEREDTGITEEHIIYDENGNIISREYYKKDPEDGGMTMANRKDLGYACVKYTYEGNVWVRTEYLDADGNPVTI